MTFAIFIVLFVIFFFAGINLLPAMPSNVSAFQESITNIIGILKAWNFILPVSDLFVCVAIITVASIALWTLKLTKWLIGVVRGTGTQ